MGNDYQDSAGTLVPARHVWGRYGITSRTLCRWLQRIELGFPKPLVVNARRYWRLSEIEAWERACAAEQRRAA